MQLRSLDVHGEILHSIQSSKLNVKYESSTHTHTQWTYKCAEDSGW